MTRIILIGDIHGCYDELCDLLEEVDYQHGHDRLISLGDLVDRGPKSLDVIQLLHRLNAECVIGNHDERLVRYRRHQKKQKENPSYVIPMKPPINPVFGELTEEDWQYLDSLPYYIRFLPDWVAIHAGLEPGLSIERQDPGTLIHCRYIRKSTGKAERSIFSLTPETSCIWTELWDGRENIVYGHMVTPTRTPLISVTKKWGGFCVGLDTGCCFGFSLTAMVMSEDGRNFTFHSVPARETYDPDLHGYLGATTVS